MDRVGVGMANNEERPRPGQGIEGAKDGTSCKPFLPAQIPSVNPDSPRLWAAFRRFARNHRRIARLMVDNEILLDRIRQIQGGAS